MSSINKLSIRGVRSFSPDDEEQVLEFYHPLTVIVGANGCGKTTIIEALRFAVAGALPPGKTAGQAFVHDPRSIGHSIVKANVKLRFTNKAGKTMVVVRSMELTQKKTTLSFKQLDGTVRLTDDNGVRQSMSHKCSELDRQIPMMLGVSKAILEHVIFCHQEESSWPLQEGAVLKKKFDEIFDSTRYTKALDVFSKLKKEYALKAKDLKADVAEYKSHRHAAHQFRRELQQINDEMEILEDELKAVREEMKENEHDQARVQAIISQVQDFIMEEQDLQQDMLTKESVVEKHRSMLAEDLTGQYDMQQLKDRLREFDEGVESKVSKKQDLEERMATLQREVEMYRKKHSDLQADIGRLQAEKATHQKNLTIRFEKMVEIGTKFGLEEVVTQITQNSQLTHGAQSQNASFMSQLDTSSIADSTVTMSQAGPGGPILEISSADMDAFFRAVGRKKEDLESELKEQKRKRAHQEDASQQELAQLIGKLESLRTEHSQTQQEDKKLHDELDKYKKQTQQSGQRLRKTSVQDAEEEAAKAARARDEMNNNKRRTDIPTELRYHKDEIERLTAKIAAEKATLDDLRSSAEQIQSINVLKEQCEKELENLQEDRGEIHYEWRQYKVSPPPTVLPGIDVDEKGEELKKIFCTVHDEISRKVEEKEHELVRDEDKVKKHQQFVSEKSALLKHDEEALNTKRPRMVQTGHSFEEAKRIFVELREYEQRDLQVPTPAIVSFEKPDTLMEYLNDRVNDIEGSSTLGVPPETVRKIMKKLFRLGAKSEECPCCERPLTEQDRSAFSKQMKVLAGENGESPLVKTDEKEEAMKKKYLAWKHQLKPLVKDIAEHQRIKNEVEDLEKSVRVLKSQVSGKMAGLKEAQEAVDVVRRELSELREFFSKSKGWQDAATRIQVMRSQAKQRLDDFKGLHGDKSGRDLEEVEKDVEKLHAEKERSNNKILDLNIEMSELNEKVSQLAQVATRKEKTMQDVKAKYNEELKAQERINEIKEQLSRNTVKKDKCSSHMAPLENKIKDKKEKQDSMRQLLSEEEENIQGTLSSFNELVNGVRQVVDSIKNFEIANHGDDDGRYEKQAEEYETKINVKRQEQSKLKPELDRITKIVDDQETQKKNLTQNIELLETQKNMEMLNQKIAVVKQKRSRVEGGDKCQEDKKKLEGHHQKLSNRKAMLKGKRDQLHESKKSAQRKLSQREYKTVDEDFRQASIKCDTTEMAVKDVERYHSALDRALQRYHTIKIAEINNIIKDLWNLTYKGEDITGIQIVSGADAVLKASKSYNYRVVMSKGSTQMDMRGRCSAGQRVLASIVIRLALAQTFCIQSGCIALDEPTVNLDYNNKKGLAIALAQIIATRSEQSNFQLILITHDEDFVIMMKNELSAQAKVSMPEYYHQVRREEGADGKFYSKIDRVDWEELL